MKTLGDSFYRVSKREIKRFPKFSKRCDQPGSVPEVILYHHTIYANVPQISPGSELHSRSTALLYPPWLQSSQLYTAMSSSMVSTKMLHNLWPKSSLFTTTSASKEAFVLAEVIQMKDKYCASFIGSKFVAHHAFLRAASSAIIGASYV